MSSKPVRAEDVIADLRSGAKHDLVILAIPSHDKHKKLLNNQELWAKKALELFSALYGGATAYETFRGVYRSASGEDLWDNPIMIESLAEREHVEDRARLEQLLDFMRRMKRELRQEAVMLVINDYRRFI